MMTNEVMPANSLLFEDFCIMLQQLFKKKKQRQEQERILSKYIGDVKLNVAKVEGKKNSSIFPILRLILPQLEKERAPYNLKESKLGGLLVKVLSLNKLSHDAVKLLNFKSVNSSGDSDFAGVAYFVLKNRVSTKTNAFTIGDVNDTLDKIASAEVGNKGPILDDAFSYVIKNLTAEQLKWFLRIILKDLKIGMGVNRILSIFHPDAPELYESCSNLSKVCDELAEGDTRPLELGIQMFYAISPMLSERLDVTAVSQLPLKTYEVENKFDGERFQMHMKDGVFEYFSRKGHSYADNYGKSYDSGLLTPFLKDCFSANITSFILDGEMMGWHKHNQCFGSKGMAYDIKKITENSKFRPCFCAFDVLYYNGKSLVGPSDKGGEPLHARLKLLDTMFNDVPGVIQHSRRQIVKESTEILDALNKAIENQDEGIVLKDVESYYIANRRNAGWYKVKPEYTEGTMSDLDLVIIGADEAENKRQGRAKSFHVACADSVNPGDMPHRWVCVGRVATGLTHAERERVCAALARAWTPSRHQPPPPTLVFNKEKPDFWIMPEHSVVLEVRATELIRSTSYGSAYTLRFPRVLRVRDDKPVKDIMTLDEYNNLANNKGPVIKLSTKRINQEQISETEMKTRRKRTSNAPQVAEQFRTTPIGNVEATSKALLGRKICILSDDEDCSKAELMKIVESHGGKNVAHIGPDTWCGVVGRMTPHARAALASRAADVASAAWLRALPPSNALCLFSPLDTLALTDATKLALARDYDAFGDSYVELTDESTLRRCFEKMEANEPEIYLTTQEMLDIDAQLFGENNPYSFLRPCVIFPVGCAGILIIQAKMYGATVCDIRTSNVTHIVISKTANTEDVGRIKKKHGNSWLVSVDWLETCVLEKKLVCEKKFILR